MTRLNDLHGPGNVRPSVGSSPWNASVNNAERIAMDIIGLED